MRGKFDENFPIHTLKIDRSFVTDMPQSDSMIRSTRAAKT